MMFRTRILGLLLVCLTGWGCASGSEADVEAGKVLSDTVTVLKATRDIEPGEELSDDMVVAVEVPTTFLPSAPLFAGDLEEWEGTPLALKVDEGRLLEGRDFTPVECAGAAPAALEMPRAAKVTATADHIVKTSPSGKAQITMLAAEANAFVGVLEMEAGATVPAHRDATEEYIYVLEGEGTITIDGTEHKIGPGNMVYMPAEAEVSFANSDKPMKVLQVFAGPKPAEKYDAWTAKAAAP